MEKKHPKKQTLLQRAGAALQRTGGAAERTGGALERTWDALQTSGGALGRTCGALQRTDGWWRGLTVQKKTVLALYCKRLVLLCRGLTVH